MKLKKLIKRFKFQRKKKRVRTSCNEDLDLTFLSQMNHFHLIKSQIQEMADAFMFFDKNGDGVITEKELGEVMRTVGENPTERELLEMIAEVDIDGSGTVDFKEFLMLMSRKLTSEDMENDIRAAFKVFDRNGDGFISAAELRTTMTNIGYTLTEEEMSQFMTDADLDGDGQITYEEFAKMLLG